MFIYLYHTYIYIYIYNQSIYLSVRVGGVLQYAISRDEDHPLPYPAW